MSKYISVGVGLSKGKDSYEVGKKAVEEAIKNMKLDGSREKPTFGFIFCGYPGFDVKEMSQGVQDVLGKFGADWVGCTTGGEISPEGPSFNSCVALVLSSEEMEFSVGVSEGLNEHPIEAGESAMKKAMTDEFKSESNDKKFVIPLMSGCVVQGKNPAANFEAVSGIYNVVDTGVAIAGAAAGDNGYLTKTYLFHNGKVYENAIIITAVTSNLKFVTGVGHGCTEVKGEGKEIEVSVDKVVGGNVVLSLDGKPALKRYSELLGVSENELMDKFPLPTGAMLQKIAQYCLKNPFAMDIGTPKPAIKLPFAATPEGLVFHDKVIEGVTLKFMEANDELNIDAVRSALKKVSEEKEKPAFSLLFNCIMRWMELGEKKAEEIKRAKELLKSPFIGFYTYGEVGYPGKDMPSYFGYTTTTITVFDELVN